MASRSPIPERRVLMRQEAREMNGFQKGESFPQQKTRQSSIPYPYFSPFSPNIDPLQKNLTPSFYLYIYLSNQFLSTTLSIYLPIFLIFQFNSLTIFFSHLTHFHAIPEKHNSEIVNTIYAACI